MIKINTTSNSIEFSPRVGFGRNTKPTAGKLIFAHVCPSCKNVIQALFLTDTEINLWPYEETNVMSIDKEGKKPIERIKVVPGEDDPKGKTQYNSIFDARTKSQKIILKNHILKVDTIDLKSSLDNIDWEPGGKVCEWAGLFSLREDLLLKDYVLFSRINETKVWDYSPKSMDDMHFTERFKVNGFPVKATGDAPPVILIRYNNIHRGWEHAVIEFLGHTAVKK